MKRAFAHYVARKQRVAKGKCCHKPQTNSRRARFCKRDAASGSEYCKQHGERQKIKRRKFSRGLKGESN